MMNLDGVLGDARKRIEAATGEPFDRHPECLLCGKRDQHTHIENDIPAERTA